MNFAPNPQHMNLTSYATFQTNVETGSPLEEESKVLYISSNKAHEGGAHGAALVIDPQQNVLYVWLLKNGVATEFKEKGKTIPLPKDIQTMLDNQATLNKNH